MKQSEFVKRVADMSGMSLEDTKDFVNCVLNVISKELINGGEMWFSGFGRFYTYEMPEREGTNPQTHEKVKYPAKRYAKFKAGRVLTNAIAEHDKNSQ